MQLLLSDPKDNLSKLSKKHLLLDTNFLIDALRYSSQFSKLITAFDLNDLILVSIEATLIEFVKGSKSIEDHAKKVEYYNSIVKRILPIESSIRENVSNIISVLLKKGGQLSYTDSLLLGTAMKYKDNLYLLTKDRSDIPISLFIPVASILIETPDNNCSFVLYEFNEKEYISLLRKRVDEIGS